MLEYDRIDVSEGTDIKKKKHWFTRVYYLSLLVLCWDKF